jgi:hypothetical protein
MARDAGGHARGGAPRAGSSAASPSRCAAPTS